MVQGVYVASVVPGSGKSLVALGLADALHRRTGRLGFFRPFVNEADPQQDPFIGMLRRLYGLEPSRCRGGIPLATVKAEVAAGLEDDVLSRALTEYAEVSEGCDAVIVDGSELRGNDSGRELDLNARLARNLGLPVLAVVGAQQLSADEAAIAVKAALRQFEAERCPVLAVVVNRADVGTAGTVLNAVRRAAGEIPAYVIPEVAQISTPTVADVAAVMGLAPVSGSTELDRDVGRISLAAMTVDNLLVTLKGGDLVVVAGDRSDLMVACLASSLTADLPTPAGIILADGLVPGESVLRLLAHAPFPVFRVSMEAYQVARDAAGVRSEIHTGESRRKLAAALGVWSGHVDETGMRNRLALPQPATMTPLRFLNALVAKARQQERRIVLAEGSDTRVLRAAEILRRRGVCKVTVLGSVAAVQELAETHGIDVSGVQILDPAGSPLRERFAAEYCRLRSHKAMTMERAREIMLDGAYFGTMMVHLGEADGMVSGAAHTTANTIRPALEFIKGRDGAGLVSSVFFMLFPDRVFVYGDCAVVPEPSADQLAAIAIASADTASRFGVEPRVAMLSYSTGGSGSGTAVEKVRRATELVKALRPDLPVDGPLQYDAAVDATIASSKLPSSAVAGKATVFIFPDLNTGNNTYKAVEQSSGAVAVGPILQGLRQPINDLSRGSTVEDIINTVAITAVQAQNDG
ncbi:phosphate acetyltransferase [Paenarthrobacter nitroguajacolicus]|uniref:phosphate acetyltransferase n=1 Tax=Paenarthrobacter nitroguajacolicus TaxID=211146 RepID=UPI002858C0DE|nr:phosphate acetyltransferase [Paenarthrobacter nitroguajacolicus]MDR6636873.1 phosphate acetyltransferase [Paenarthrobacter nitroguajacolicus]